MSIRNGKFQRTTFDEAAMVGKLQNPATNTPNPMGPWGTGGIGGAIDDPAVQQAEGQRAMADLATLQAAQTKKLDCC